MTFAALKEELHRASKKGAALGREAIQEKGLEGPFVRVAAILEAYADGYQDAGGSLERLMSREMDESYTVELNDLLRQLKD